MARILYWCDATAEQPFESGIQRVTRRLADNLRRIGVDVLPVGFDRRSRLMRPLAQTTPDSGQDVGLDTIAPWLIVPEIPITILGADLDPIQLARAYDCRAAAIVHDLIPMRLPHLYGPEAHALFRRYYRMFAGCDVVFATTQLVAGHLRAHLAAEGLRVPEICVVPLPGQFADLPRVTQLPPARDPREPLRLLTVSTWEPRKNLPALLRASQTARKRSTVPIMLTLVGRQGDYPDLDREIKSLLADLPGCIARPRAADAELASLYATHHASVYPSCEEGFGMPVLESLWLGRPCLCHTGSAMAEVAPGGGTLMLDMGDEMVIADALVRMAEQPDFTKHLIDEAQARPLRNWMDYATDLAMQIGLSTQARR